jgi:hypothetical protein
MKPGISDDFEPEIIVVRNEVLLRLELMLGAQGWLQR